jgi:hypothetical protein
MGLGKRGMKIGNWPVREGDWMPIQAACDVWPEAEEYPETVGLHFVAIHEEQRRF